MNSYKTLSIYNPLLTLPTPVNISSGWNFGSLLGLCLITQIMTGIFLAMHYSSEISTAFLSVDHIMRDVNYGWGIRAIHSNTASLFFMCLYIHTGRGLYYSSYKLTPVWVVGSTILILIMASAFLGYVLPWGQMSFWGATVITNLFSVIPGIGDEIVIWLWGGFSVDKATLSRFFALHYLIPLLSTVGVMAHTIFLHSTGSSNPLGVPGNYYKIPFDPYYTFKDAFGFGLIFCLMGALVSYSPWLLADPENFIPANPLVTPAHIQPEWYFLFAYAILRSIPNKLGGVVALALSVSILFFFPFLLGDKSTAVPATFNPSKMLMFWAFIGIFFLLTWIGAKPVEGNYIFLGQVFTVLYFGVGLSLPYSDGLWAKLLLVWSHLTGVMTARITQT
uniref:Cytochrome b n=1 Tax=Lepeophtheirus salmonis TaxID=72036 RepID=Q2KRI8_LEPSM|nr:cytochrome b [Lepeophtheirus salmonis]